MIRRAKEYSSSKQGVLTKTEVFTMHK